MNWYAIINLSRIPLLIFTSYSLGRAHGHFLCAKGLKKIYSNAKSDIDYTRKSDKEDE